MKKKHIKNKKRLQEKKKQQEPCIDFDTSAYKIYNRLELTYPSLSFDIVTDGDGSAPERVDKFPLSLNLVAGAQTPANVVSNYMYVVKVTNIGPLKQENEDEENEDDESNDEDEADDPNNLPKLNSIRVPVSGNVNRLRIFQHGGKVLSSTWSDKAKVHIYDLTVPILAVSDQKSINTYVAQKIEPKPIFTFGGHLTEGYAVDWSPNKLGSLATGDCKKNIHIWTMRNQSDWNVNQIPLTGHENSVEDIKWSPTEPDVLASCSVDKSIRIWDLRLPVTARCANRVLDCHKSDINVIDWNKKIDHLIVSGGDDGVVKVWDLRFIRKNHDEVTPVAQFDYHKKPITSVEWDPNDDTVMAVASEDDRLTIWDLAVEKDDEQALDDEVEMKMLQDLKDLKEDEDEEMEEDNEDEEEEDIIDGVNYGGLNFKTIPEQMLFLHQGQVELKELHWHPQLKGLLISTALNGLNIFKTISA